MKTVFSILLAFSCHQLLVAQACFKKEITINNSSSSFSRDLIALSANRYAIFGNSIDSVNGTLVNKLTILFTDSVGNILDKKSYGSVGSYYSSVGNASHFFRLIDSCFYVPTACYDSTGAVSGALLKFDLNGNLIWKQIRSSSDSTLLPFYDVCETSDGSIMVVGREVNVTQIDPTFRTYLGKYTKNGAFLWEKKIASGFPNKSELPSAILQDSFSQDFIVCGAYWANYKQTGAIFIFDSIGNKKMGFSLNYNLGTVLTDLIKLSDGNYIAIGSKDFNVKINENYTLRSFLVKFASNGSFIKSNWFDALTFDGAFTRIIELPDQKLLTLGYVGWGDPWANNYNGVSRVTLLDKNTDFLWSKYYDHTVDEFNFDQAWGLSLAPNSRIIFTSACYTAQWNSKFMLYRIDTLACDAIVDSCAAITGVADITGPSPELLIWPIPVAGFCFLKIPSFEANNYYRAEISNIWGKVVLDSQLFSEVSSFDLESQPPGLLFCNLYVNGKRVSTTKIIR